MGGHYKELALVFLQAPALGSLRPRAWQHLNVGFTTAGRRPMSFHGLVLYCDWALCSWRVFGGMFKSLQRIAAFKLEGGLRAVSFQVLSLRLCSIFMRKSVEW